MDHLRDGIWAMGYGERNPLVENKIEGSRIFSNMMINMKEDIIEYMMKVEVQRIEEERPVRPGHAVSASEFHPEVDQFGAGGIPMSAPETRKTGGEDKHTEGGVKRKKTRRSRR
jgi:preprotein translocase subunit SecA